MTHLICIYIYISYGIVLSTSLYRSGLKSALSIVGCIGCCIEAFSLMVFSLVLVEITVPIPNKTSYLFQLKPTTVETVMKQVMLN